MIQLLFSFWLFLCFHEENWFFGVFCVSFGNFIVLPDFFLHSYSTFLWFISFKILIHCGSNKKYLAYVLQFFRASLLLWDSCNSFMKIDFCFHGWKFIHGNIDWENLVENWCLWKMDKIKPWFMDDPVKKENISSKFINNSSMNIHI